MEMYPDVEKTGIDPWHHYAVNGKKEGRDNGLHPAEKMFFAEGYLEMYPDVADSGMDPWQHYVLSGKKEGRDCGLHPSKELFFAEGYLEMSPDVAVAGVDPWHHYVLNGKKEGRDSGLHPGEDLFFPEGYLEMYPDVATSGMDPWHHYVLNGKKEGRDSGLHPGEDLFFPEGYLEMYPDVAPTGMDPWHHYVLNGKKEGRDCGLHPAEETFFSEGYLEMYPDVAESGMDPWHHYVLIGKAEGRDSGLHPAKNDFFPEGYLEMYPDVEESGRDPWHHYVLFGKEEDRDNGLHPNDNQFFSEGYAEMYPDAAGKGEDLWHNYVLSGKTEGRDNGLHPQECEFFPQGYLAMYPDVEDSGEDPWHHYVLTGKKECLDNGLHPNADLFSADGYLAMYTDVGQSGMDPWHHYVLNGKAEGRDNGNHMQEYIQKAMWGILPSFNLRIDNTRPVSINIIMPEISKHMSAGPLSILYFGRFLLSNDYHVRLLVISDSDSETLKENLKYQDEDISKISDKFEISSVKLQKHHDVYVNDSDMSVATFFNTANIAAFIQSRCRNRRFIYFIQDDEREFFPASSLRCAVEESYAYDCYPIFSTKILAEHFLNEDLGQFRTKKSKVIWQGCPANYYLPPFEKFALRNKKKFVFYARPNNPRNCYEFALNLLIQAIKRKLFNDQWEFYGIGFPRNCELRLPGNRILHMFSNMPLEKYRENLSTYDVALSLMATPHPSMPPVDFSLSGCIVVTNTYKNKTESQLKEISQNIVCAPLLLEPLLDAVGLAIMLSDDIEFRYRNAINSSWPKSWDSAFSKEHRDWVKDIMDYSRKMDASAERADS